MTTNDLVLLLRKVLIGILVAIIPLLIYLIGLKTVQQILFRN